MHDQTRLDLRWISKEFSVNLQPHRSPPPEYWHQIRVSLLSWVRIRFHLQHKSKLLFSQVLHPVFPMAGSFALPTKVPVTESKSRISLNPCQLTQFPAVFLKVMMKSPEAIFKTNITFVATHNIVRKNTGVVCSYDPA
jgi:hypothetical protein